MYAPFGAGVLVGPRDAFTEGDPFLAGRRGGRPGRPRRGRVDRPAGAGGGRLPERDRRRRPPRRHRRARRASAGRPWPTTTTRSRPACAPPWPRSRGVRLLGPALDVPTLPDGGLHRRGRAPRAGGRPAQCRVRHRRPPRLLLRPPLPAAPARPRQRPRWPPTGAPCSAATAGEIPGAVRASAGLSTSAEDVDRLVAAVTRIAGGDAPPVSYEQDAHTGDFWPRGDHPGWTTADRGFGAACARG